MRYRPRAAFLFALLATLPLLTTAATDDDSRWQALKTALYGDRVLNDGSEFFELEAPKRAHNAALVPITVAAKFPQKPEQFVKTITVLIDENPSPVAGKFHLTEASGLAYIQTRVRVNQYSYLRAVAEMNSGDLYLVSKYVKASGGCSAPAQKDAEAALARLGKMKLRHGDSVTAGEPNRFQLLISHPNHTGMQMNQVTQHYIPAHFVRDVKVTLNGEPLLKVESDISLSENPSIHFQVVPSGPGELTAEVTDTDGTTFTQTWSVEPNADGAQSVSVERATN